MRRGSSLFVSEETKHRDDMRAIALAEFELQKEAQSQNLRIQHRTMIVALAAVVVALLSSLLALVIAITQNPPVVKVQVPQTPVNAKR